MKRMAAGAIALMCMLGVRTVAHADDMTAEAEFSMPGPYPVVTTVRVNPCQESIYGTVLYIESRVFGNVGDLTCTQAFPYDLESPMGVNTYYPENIAELPNAPLLVFHRRDRWESRRV